MIGKRIVSLITAASLVLGIFGLNAVPVSAASTTDVKVRATFGQTEARSMLSYVNELREPGNAWYWDESNTQKVNVNNLSPLTYDYELEKVAMQRALELVISYAHTRPNGERCFTAYPSSYSSYAKGENIAYGYNSAINVFIGWREQEEDYDGQGHRRNMLSSSFKSIGIGHVYYNGRHYWAQEFSSKSPNTSATAADDSTREGTVAVPNSDLSKVAQMKDVTVPGYTNPSSNNDSNNNNNNNNNQNYQDPNTQIGIQATYIGGKKKQGDTVTESDFEVYSLYPQGTKVRTYYHTVADGLLKNVGTNQVKVRHNGYQVTVNVTAEAKTKSDTGNNATGGNNGKTETKDQTGAEEKKEDESADKKKEEPANNTGTNTNTGTTSYPAGAVLRVYNKNSGEHFFTKSEKEMNALVSAGWKYEGVAWESVEGSEGPAVYRVYNKNSGEHFYTKNSTEKANLVNAGWKDEGVAWYSDGDEYTPVYRLFNPNDKGPSSHHYTTGKTERDKLVSAGWKYEGIAWYGS